MTAPIVEDTENGHSCSQKQDISLRNGRTILSCDQARAIFMSKPTLSSNRKYHTTKLAKFYGVSPKTIRDIWVGRTWYRATYFLDASKPASAERLQKKLGRPRGAKDIKPRAKKHPSYFDFSLQSLEQSLLYQIVGSTDMVMDTNVTSLEPKTGFNAAEDMLSSSPFYDSYIATTSSADVTHAAFSSPKFEAPIDWAAYISEGWCRSSPFNDPFHDDWAYWPQ